MTEERFHPWRAELGAYLVGALEPDEAEALLLHLTECPACRLEHDALAAAVALLDAVPAEVFTASAESDPEPAVSEPDPARWERLCARAGLPDPAPTPPPLAPPRPVRSRLRWPSRAGASAALSGGLVALAAAGVFAGVQATSGPPALASATVTAVNSSTGVSGTVKYSSTDWGSAVELTLKGAPQGDNCVMYAIDGQGNRSVAGSWWVPQYGSQTVPGGVAMQASHIRQFVVETTDGDVLLTVPVS